MRGRAATRLKIEQPFLSRGRIALEYRKGGNFGMKNQDRQILFLIISTKLLANGTIEETRGNQIHEYLAALTVKQGAGIATAGPQAP